MPDDCFAGETDDPHYADPAQFLKGREVKQRRQAYTGMPVYRFTALHLTDEALRFGYGCEFSSCPL